MLVALRRGVGLVLALIGVAVFISVASVALMFAAVSGGPSVPSSAALVLRPGGSLPEVEPDDVVGQVLGRDMDTVRGFVDALRRARGDSRVRSVLLMPSTLELPYWGKVQEMRDAVLEFRKSGKSVTAFLEFGGDREYYLASAADRVFLLPTSPLDLTGVASYEIFLRGAFDKIGAQPDFVHVGEYKTAANQLTERGFTPEHREMTESLNRDMYEQLIAGIAESRKKPAADVRALVDRGPFGPEAALDAGLVDGLAYEDQLDDHVPELAEDEATRLEGRDYRRAAGSIGVRQRPRIAVLYAVGTIVSGRSGFDAVNGTVLGSETMVEQIRKIRDDDSIRAIVLRIDSPGGSSVASDVIWRELMITREENPSRPIVASMSDLAASGGYYIAMPSDVIVAQPGTLTGSIGIFGGKIAIGGTLEKLGVATETVTSGANADIYSPFDTFSPDERARLQSYMQGFYDNFVKKVADSRKATPEKIHAVAQGRVWTGRQALEQGLVDSMGGLEAAVAIARERAGIAADEDVQLVVYPERRSLFDALSAEFGGVRSGGLWGLLAGTTERRAMAALAAPRLFRRGEPLALMPFMFVR
jgi:protease-4